MAGNTVTGDAPIDGLFNYELHEEVGRGAVAIVYRATSKRGRFRNRQVAVKKIPRSSGVYPPSDFILSASLHSALYHPSIVSLISTFNAPSGYYQVLELHQEGTFANLLYARASHVLAETELRGVARTLIDALIYLKKELVLHRDINPSNIMVTQHGRIKLSGFGAAVKLLSADTTIDEFCGSANYVSPEILSGRSYGFAADLWSVGCVLVTCLSGVPAFNASNPDDVYNKICNVQYTLPISASSEVQDLISSILQKNTQDRAALHRIPSHVFFQPSLPATPLKLISSKTESSTSHRPVLEKDTHKLPSARRYPSHLSRDPARPRPTPDSCSKTKPSIRLKRVPLGDITNTYSERSTDDGDNLLRAPQARIVPAPDPIVEPRAPTPAGSVDTRASILSSGGFSSQHGLRYRAPSSLELAHYDFDRNSERSSPRSQLRRVLSDPCDLPVSRRAVSLPTVRPRLYSRNTDAPQPRVSSLATTTTVVSHPRSPARGIAVKDITSAQSGGNHGIGRSGSLNTHRLKPQTHKVSRGQLVVLPSRSLLVDFREGERRKGGKGREVMVISGDGGTIEVYDAPHLSTPCCLAEATAVYSLAHLPKSYVKQYNDAARLVDQLQARMPKLVHYADEAKCTLMANGPAGDIEVVIPAEEDRKNQQKAIRLRLHQKKCTLEISRYSGQPIGSRGRKDLGEWTKKVVALCPDLTLVAEDKTALDDLERLAMRHLSEFLRICDVANSPQDRGEAKP